MAAHGAGLIWQQAPLGAWLLGARHIGQQCERKVLADSVTFSRLLKKPSQYTEQAICRMECRCRTGRRTMDIPVFWCRGAATLCRLSSSWLKRDMWLACWTRNVSERDACGAGQGLPQDTCTSSIRICALLFGLLLTCKCKGGCWQQC